MRMKTIILNENGKVLRVPDDTARFLISTNKAKPTSKAVWKKSKKAKHIKSGTDLTDKVISK